MSTRKSWLAQKLADLVMQVQNFIDKIPNYATELGLTPEEVADMVANGGGIVLAINATEASRLTQKAMTQWREAVLSGDPQGSAAPAAPTFAVISANLLKRGSLTTFVDNRDMIVSLPNYTDLIGSDLGLIGTSSTKKPADETQPLFKSVSASGNQIKLVGSMQGMKTMIVEYAQKGGNYRQIGTITNLPASLSVTTATPGQAESGSVRAYFLSKNERYGNNSSNYDVVLS